MEFEQISRQIAFIAEKRRDVIKKPYCSCYCCQDTGYVNYHLILLVIPNYQIKSDKIPVCNRFHCQGRQNISINLSDRILDERFNSELCEKLHHRNLAIWQEWEIKAQKRKEEVDKFVNNVGR